MTTVQTIALAPVVHAVIKRATQSTAPPVAVHGVLMRLLHLLLSAAAHRSSVPVDPDAVHAIREQGFAVLPTAGAPSAVVDAARDAVHTRLSELLAAVDDAGCDIVEQQYSFNEICHRKRLRWDMRMPADCEARTT